MQDILQFDTGFFVCVFKNDVYFKQAFNLSQICHHICDMNVFMYRLLYYVCIPFDKVALESIKQLRALQIVLPCLICTCIVH